MSAPRPQVLAFLEAIKESPDDDTPRLILADWLRENGDEARGDFIALQCRLARLHEDDPERAATETRESDLLGQHANEWLGPLCPLVRNWKFHRGLLTITAQIAKLLKATKQAAAWSENWAWVESLRLEVGRPLRRLSGLTVLRQITGLDLRSAEIDDDGMELLVALPHLTRLVSLGLESQRISTTGVTMLVRSPLMGRLTELNLKGNLIDDGGIAILAASRPSRLTRLDLSFNVFQLMNPRVLTALCGFQHLSSLDLSANALRPQGVHALATMNWTRLSRLYLDRTGVGAEEVKALARSPGMAHLSTLSLRWNDIGLEGATALAESPYLNSLRCLRLSRHKFPNAAVAAVTARFGKAVRIDRP
jgi:uncharacterized protein (TIGR02996 family)